MRTLKVLTFMAIAIAPSLQGRPHIIINGDPPDPTTIFSNFFSFKADPLGGGDLSFVNGSNERFTQFDIFATLPELEAVSCTPGPFLTCTQIPLSPGSAMPFALDIELGPAPNGGIAPGEAFSVSLNDNGNEDPNGVGSWGANATFSVDVNGAPEPSAGALSAVGCFAVLAGFLYRRSKRRQSV